jgi:hypothetical protein
MAKKLMAVFVLVVAVASFRSEGAPAIANGVLDHPLSINMPKGGPGPQCVPGLACQ